MKTEIVQTYLQKLQDQLCVAFQKEEGNNAKFREDYWVREHQQGEGRTRIFENGKTFERVGINYSQVKNLLLPPAATLRHPQLIGAHYEAISVSLVSHPYNPYVPTAHMNVRFFVANKEGIDPVWWFGGGYDLTPYYGFVEDCVHWHETAKAACDAIDLNLYPRFKKAADEYFYLKHRQEPRGIGGIFFDDFNELGFERSFQLMRRVGDSFLSAYLPIVKKRKALLFGEDERWFQCYRRGRYVEFNLVWDRGTAFGLQTSHRPESILVSMPPNVLWCYDWKPQANSVEARLYSEFLPPKDWV